MKKTIIAACMICLTLVAVLAGNVFASVTDTVVITIENSCALASDVESDDDAAEVEEEDLTAIMKPNQIISDLGTSTINVKCNNDKGYAIRAIMSDLEGKVSLEEDAESNDDVIEYGTSLGAGRWTASYNSVGIENGSNVVVTSTMDDMADGSEYVIKYGIQTREDQATGYYTGTATYELSQNS